MHAVKGVMVKRKEGHKVFLEGKKNSRNYIAIQLTVNISAADFF